MLNNCFEYLGNSVASPARKCLLRQFLLFQRATVMGRLRSVTMIRMLQTEIRV